AGLLRSAARGGPAGTTTGPAEAAVRPDVRLRLAASMGRYCWESVVAAFDAEIDQWGSDS
ncbi:MAG TPA: hypothetical protein VMQ62_08090, partial [Dongiaceae bacterium]|nr:hypothetical protein [Dongiaceae bacterium]